MEPSGFLLLFKATLWRVKLASDMRLDRSECPTARLCHNEKCRWVALLSWQPIFRYRVWHQARTRSRVEKRTVSQHVCPCYEPHVARGCKMTAAARLKIVTENDPHRSAAADAAQARLRFEPAILSRMFGRRPNRPAKEGRKPEPSH